MTARFVILDAFDLTGRGTVLVGDIAEGFIRVGMHFRLTDGTVFIVRGLEFLDSPGRHESHVGLMVGAAQRAAELRAALPPGSEIELESEPSVLAPVSHRELRRFWFPLPVGFGIGVTAASEAEARMLAFDALARYHPTVRQLGDVVTDVDIRTLDAQHVLPNIGPPAVRGVWYPALNT